VKGYYEDFYGFGWRKNKANSKPNKPNIGQCKIDFIYNTEDCHGPLGLAMTPKVNLKKQSQSPGFGWKLKGSNGQIVNNQ